MNSQLNSFVVLLRRYPFAATCIFLVLASGAGACWLWTDIDGQEAARIDRAKELLRKTDLLIAEIAHRVGFRNQSHFSFAFRRAAGMTPREFRGGN